MKTVEIQQIGGDLAGYLSMLKDEPEIMLCENGKPVAKLTRELPREVLSRRIGNPIYPFEVTEAFFEPLPDDILDAFNNPK